LSNREFSAETNRFGLLAASTCIVGIKNIEEIMVSKMIDFLRNTTKNIAYHK